MDCGVPPNNVEQGYFLQGRRPGEEALSNITGDQEATGAADCISPTDRELAEHYITPVYADVASTGVISAEYGQAVSHFGAANSIAF
jgi:hypothetical protein